MPKGISGDLSFKLTILFSMLFVLVVDAPGRAVAGEIPALRRVSLAAETQAQPHEGTIVAFGDSLTEGFRLDEEQAYPAKLEKKLHANGYRYKVVNAGISGETSSGALSRINWILKLKPDIVILETGANDGFRGISTDLIEKNITEIIRILKEHRVIVVLGGMRMLSNLGGEYTRAFNKVYSSVAEKEGVILMPFFLEGVAGDPKLNLPDTIHPTAEGYSVVTDKIYPYVIRAIERKRAQARHEPSS
jgi:acyl-CoA thioesterase-1